MTLLIGLLVLWNGLMLLIEEILMGRVFRTLFPLNAEERLEGYRQPLSKQEFWWRLSIFFALYIGSNAFFFVLILMKAGVL